MQVKSGIYKHYKGQYYRVLGEAVHSDTEEPFVLYERLYAYQGHPRYFIKPEKDFTTTVEWEGRTVARFEFIEE